MYDVTCRACGSPLRRGSGRFDNVLCPECAAWLARQNYRVRYNRARISGTAGKALDKYSSKWYNKRCKED